MSDTNPIIKETNPLLRSARSSAGLQLAVLFGSFFVMLLLASILVMLIDWIKMSDRTQMLISSSLQGILAFCVPAYLLARYTGKNATEWLHLNKKPSIRALIGVLIVYVLSLPAMEWLINWNSNWHFPEAMSGIESTLRSWESNAEQSTRVLLDAHGIMATITGVLVIGVLTGFSEEMFFRAGVQGIFSRTSLGSHVAIWMGAIIFSAMHFQFFGFLPRLLMGVFFGYLLFWTGSLWVPVFAHALNNSVVVVTSAITGNMNDSMVIQSHTGLSFGEISVVIGSAVITLLFILIYFKPSSYAAWQKNQQAPVSER